MKLIQSIEFSVYKRQNFESKIFFKLTHNFQRRQSFRKHDPFDSLTQQREGRKAKRQVRICTHIMAWKPFPINKIYKCQARQSSAKNFNYKPQTILLIYCPLLKIQHKIISAYKAIGYTVPRGIYCKTSINYSWRCK